MDQLSVVRDHRPQQQGLRLFIYNMKKGIYVIIAIAILIVLSISSDQQFLLLAWIFIGYSLIKILTEK